MPQINDKNSKRIKILSTAEIKDLYGLPQFTAEERAHYFALDDDEFIEMKKSRSLGGKVLFILQLGYFKYTPYFQELKLREIQKDIQYILSQYFEENHLSKLDVSSKVQWHNKSRILKLLQFKPFEAQEKELLITKGFESIKIQSTPRYIFDAFLEILLAKRIALPRYSTLQDIVGQCIQEERKRLNSIIYLFNLKMPD